MEIIKSNLWEVKKAGSLKTLGGILALFHVLLFTSWAKDGALPLKLLRQGQPMCWSFMENCGFILQHMPVSLVAAVYYAYLLCTSVAALVLLLTEWVAFGFYLLLIGLFLGMSLYFQDLRLSTNEGYLIFFLTVAYLFHTL